jgi:hypothetical protein
MERGKAVPLPGPLALSSIQVSVLTMPRSGPELGGNLPLDPTTFPLTAVLPHQQQVNDWQRAGLLRALDEFGNP